MLTGGLLLALACHVPAYGQEPPKPAAPGAPGQTPGAPGQASGAPGQPPGTPGQQPPAQPPGVPAQPTPPPIATPVPVIPPLPETAPVPVIPDVQLIPSPNVPSAPERVLPAPTSRAVPTARFQIDPTISVREEYSDNFFLTERNRKSNFRSTVAPGVDVTINSAFVKGLVTYEFAPSYDTEPDDFSFFHSLLGQVVWEVTPRWKLTLADTFTRSDEPAEADQLGLRQQRSAFTSNTLLAASDYLISTVATRQAYRYSTFSDDFGETKSHTVSLSATVPLLQVNSLSGGYEYLSSTSTGTNVITPGTALTTADESDVTGHRFTAGATRRLHALQTVGVTTSYALRTVSQPIGDSDFQIWNASTFTDYELPGRLRLNVTLGVLGVQTDTGDDVGPKLSTKSSLTYQFARAVATLAVDRGVSETFSEGENFGLVATEGVTASLSYPFTPSLTGLISGHYRHNKTVDVGAIGTTPQQNDESENWGGTVSLTWLIRRNLRFELSYTYTQQVGLGDRQTGATSGQFGGSFGSDNTYTENKVRAAVNLTF